MIPALLDWVLGDINHTSNKNMSLKPIRFKFLLVVHFQVEQTLIKGGN